METGILSDIRCADDGRSFMAKFDNTWYTLGGAIPAGILIIGETYLYNVLNNCMNKSYITQIKLLSPAPRPIELKATEPISFFLTSLEQDHETGKWWAMQCNIRKAIVLPHYLDLLQLNKCYYVEHVRNTNEFINWKLLH